MRDNWNKGRCTYSLAAILLFIVGTTSQAQNLSELKLSDALEASLARGATTSSVVEQVPESSQWLSSLPSIYLSYLDSDDRLGVDETELGLKLPFKSPQLRRIDKRLRTLQDEIGKARQSQLALVYSGLIREAVWEHRIADRQLQDNAEKIRLLVKLQGNHQALHAAGASSNLTLLLIRKELLGARAQRLSLEAQVSAWQQRFTRITGLGAIPGAIEERSPTDAHPFIDQHPALQLLDLQWEQDKLVLAAGGNAAQPWNLTVMGKNLDAPGYEEDQIGLAVEVPIPLSERSSVSASNSRLEGAREYHRQRDERVRELGFYRDELEAQAQSLALRSQLERETLEVADAIAQQGELLSEHSQISQAMLLRYLVEALDSRSNAALTTLRIEQNKAMQRQAAGLPL